MDSINPVLSAALDRLLGAALTLAALLLMALLLYWSWKRARGR